MQNYNYQQFQYDADERQEKARRNKSTERDNRQTNGKRARQNQ